METILIDAFLESGARFLTCICGFALGYLYAKR